MSTIHTWVIQLLGAVWSAGLGMAIPGTLGSAISSAENLFLVTILREKLLPVCLRLRFPSLLFRVLSLPARGQPHLSGWPSWRRWPVGILDRGRGNPVDGLNSSIRTVYHGRLGTELGSSNSAGRFLFPLTALSEVIIRDGGF